MGPRGCAGSGAAEEGRQGAAAPLVPLPDESHATALSSGTTGTGPQPKTKDLKGRSGTSAAGGATGAGVGGSTSARGRPVSVHVRQTPFPAAGSGDPRAWETARSAAATVPFAGTGPTAPASPGGSTQPGVPFSPPKAEGGERGRGR